MQSTLKIDISDVSESAGLVFAANYVLIIFAMVGLSIEAGDLFFAEPGRPAMHWWEQYVTAPVISLLMLVYIWLALTMDYSGRYWRRHASAGAVFASLLIGGVLVALLSLFEFSWTFLIVSVLYLAIFMPIIAAAAGLFGAALVVVETRIADYDMPLTAIFDRASAFYEPLATQRRRAPPRIPFLGRALSAIAIAGIAFMGVVFVTAGLFENHQPALHEAMSGMGGVGIFLLPVWGLLLALGQRLAQPDAKRLLATDTRQPVLLLRSFADDPKQVRSRNVLVRYLFFGLRKNMRLEAAIAPELVRLGPFIAIGEPGERLPQLGAARSYYTDDEWQQAVLEWMANARLIVLIAGRSEWVLWELRQIIAGGYLGKALVLFPPGTNEETRARWNNITGCLRDADTPSEAGAGAASATAATGIVLPELPNTEQAAQDRRAPAKGKDEPPPFPLGLHFHPTGASTLLQSKTTGQVDYEMAIRIAVFGMFCDPAIHEADAAATTKPTIRA